MSRVAQILFVLALTSLVGTAAAAANSRQAQCVICHAYAVRRRWLDIVPEWKRSAHAQHGVGCSDCHGGDPNASDFDKAMYGVPGFTARWKKRDIPALCARCHADPRRMRPYNLATDQYAQYLQSVHGRRLLVQGDDKVAVCTDCHGVHEIRARDDPESSVFKSNVPKLCAGCHADKRLMARYGLPADQYAQYLQSVHGRRLLVDEDRAAPNCADCHGAHGATPPGVEEVPAVCGTCHGRTQQEFSAGAHARPARPRCVDCHDDHGVVVPADTMLVGKGRGHCMSCHPPASAPGRVARRIHGLILDLARRSVAAGRLVQRAADASMDVSDLRPQLDRAATGLIEARAMQHSLSLARLQQKTREAQLVLATVERAARRALAESRRRRVIVLGALLVLAAGGIVLRLKLRQLMQDRPPSGRAPALSAVEGAVRGGTVPSWTVPTARPRARQHRAAQHRRRKVGGRGPYTCDRD